MSLLAKDFTAHRNPGLDHAFLATLTISSLEAELIAYEKELAYGSTVYLAQGDFTALKRLAPCQILVSFQTYVRGHRVAVFRIKDETLSNDSD